ncbi:MAG: Bug family tripartite tricarboxylate transporter substrate binding protein [Beijerinckiaceae bacterium]
MLTLSRRGLLAGAALAPFAGKASLGEAMAQAQSWPAGQTIKFTVPFPAGGSTDAVARIVQPGMQQRLGATIIVENRPGGASSIGAAAVAKSPPDGLNWLFVFDSHGVIPSLLPLTFDAKKDLDPVLLVGTAPMVLACHPSKPYKTFADVLAAAKAAPDTLTFGSIGNGSLGHLTMILLQKKGGFSVKHVPYRGGGPALNDAIGGHIDLVITSVANMAAQLAAGTLRPLLQTGEARLSNLASTQTMIEAGFKDFSANAWWGVFAPGGTPKPLVDRMTADLQATFRDERVSKTLIETQQIALRLDGPDAFRKFYDNEVAVWGAVVRENAIKPD